MPEDQTPAPRPRHWRALDHLTPEQGLTMIGRILLEEWLAEQQRSEPDPAPKPHQPEGEQS